MQCYLSLWNLLLSVLWSSSISSSSSDVCIFTCIFSWLGFRNHVTPKVSLISATSHGVLFVSVSSPPPPGTLKASCSWSCSCNHVPWCQSLKIRTLENGCGLWLGLLVSNCCCGVFSAIDIPWICVAWSEGVWKRRYWSSRFPIGMEALAERGFTEKSNYELLL